MKPPRTVKHAEAKFIVKHRRRRSIDDDVAAARKAWRTRKTMAAARAEKKEKS
jgi:hypothetical protein